MEGKKHENPPKEIAERKFDKQQRDWFIKSFAARLYLEKLGPEARGPLKELGIFGAVENYMTKMNTLIERNKSGNLNQEEKEELAEFQEHIERERVFDPDEPMSRRFEQEYFEGRSLFEED